MLDNEPSQTSFKRIMLKISGEALMGDQGYGISPPTIEKIASEVKSVHELGVQICMVIGGGNIFRGLQGAAQGCLLYTSPSPRDYAASRMPSSA